MRQEDLQMVVTSRKIEVVSDSGCQRENTEFLVKTISGCFYQGTGKWLWQPGCSSVYVTVIDREKTLDAWLRRLVAALIKNTVRCIWRKANTCVRGMARDEHHGYKFVKPIVEYHCSSINRKKYTHLLKKKMKGKKNFFKIHILCPPPMLLRLPFSLFFNEVQVPVLFFSCDSCDETEPKTSKSYCKVTRFMT